MTGQHEGLGSHGEQPAAVEIDIVTALAVSHIAAWHWEPQTGLRWSAGAAESLEVPDIVLRSPELLHRAVEERDIAVVDQAVREAWRCGGSVRAHLRATFVSGQPRWFDVIGRVLCDPQGEPMGATGVIIDVTDSQEAGEALVETLKRTEAILDRLLTAVGEWDPVNDMLTIGRQAPGLTLLNDPPNRVPLEQVLERTGTRDAGRVRDAFHNAIGRDKPFAVEILFRDDEGCPRRTLLRGGPTGDPGTRVWFAVTVLD